MTKKELSIRLIRLSICLYLLWLLLPAVQTTGRAMTGAACVGLFGLGALLDTPKKEWPWLLARALCAALMPLFLRRFMDRGGTNFAGFYVQQAMFWFPLVYAGHVRTLGDKRLWKNVRWVLGGAVVITLCTTLGWSIQGLLREPGKVYAYSRALGFAEPGNEAFLKELMLRNIGGYDFIYAMVAALPLMCIAVQENRGKERGVYLALIALTAVAIVLSQYTYAMLYAAAILAVEVMALLIRRFSKGKIGMGKSLLWGVTPLFMVLLFLQPLAQLASAVCAGLGFENFAFSFEQLGLALQGSATDPNSRLGYYLTAAQGIGTSPLFGTMFGGEQLLSYHSDILDLLSGSGLLGAAIAAGMVWLMGRGSLRGLKASPHRAQLCVMFLAVFVTALLGTVVYSRDIPTVVMLGTLMVLEE